MKSFRDRLRAGACLSGTFVKTPHPHVVEVLATSSLDCLVLDAEHAPFDRTALDLCLMAARAIAKPALVRPASATPAEILNALDCGADGVLLPHIRGFAEAEAAVRACHYGPGGRGYAGSTRAAGYGRTAMAAHRAQARHIAVVAQIEDIEAVDAIEAIARVPGIDCLFVGRADLTVALGAETPDDPRVVDAVGRVVAAGLAAGVATGMFLPRLAEVSRWRAAGASLFVLQSDHAFLAAGAEALAAAIRAD
ncbi:MAG: aldolase/citrate lyase family protein [Acetobacteraceae bacterium]|nr:aldolase/citrate lyase family protein [Acetobacteraceae bacterium]